MYHHHNRAITALICATLIFLAITFRFSQNRDTSKITNVISTGASGKSLTIDKSLFEYGSEKLPSSFSKSALGNIYKSEITARSYLVGNVITGEIYFEHNPDLFLPIASVSKLLTALITQELLATSTIVIASSTLEAFGDVGLAENEVFTADELLYPLLLQSSNDAAEALAVSYGRISFLEKMSSYGWEIGMPSTFFADPSGLSPQNISTARDLFALSRYFYKYHPDTLALTRNAKYEIASTTDHSAHTWYSIHPFVNDTRFIGGKTGHTDIAGDTMITILDIGDNPIVFIVLKSDSGWRARDTQKLIDKFLAMIS